MHRLAVFDHDIICDINDIVDWADARRTQTLAHPLGAGRNLDIAYHAGRIARAQIVRLHINIKQIAEISFCAALDDRLMVLHRHIECGSRLTGKANERVAVRAVVCDLKFDDGIIVADDDVHVLTDLAAFVVQNPDTVCIRLGAVVLCQTEFLIRAQHAAGLNAAQFALCDVDAARQV